MTEKDQQIALRGVAREHCRCKGVGNEKACNWNCPCGNSVMSGVCRNCSRDYLNDLNALHEMEKRLTLPQREYFVYHLQKLCLLTSTGLVKAIAHSSAYDLAEEYVCIHADVTQRREALLRALGLWKD